VFFKKNVKTHENFRIYVQISGPNSNFRTFQDKFQNFRTTPRPAEICQNMQSLNYDLPSTIINRVSWNTASKLTDQIASPTLTLRTSSHHTWCQCSRIMQLSFPCTFALKNESSIGGTFAPWNSRSPTRTISDVYRLWEGLRQSSP